MLTIVVFVYERPFLKAISADIVNGLEWCFRQAVGTLAR
jgi:hypothetical protein